MTETGEKSTSQRGTLGSPSSWRLYQVSPSHWPTLCPQGRPKPTQGPASESSAQTPTSPLARCVWACLLPGMKPFLPQLGWGSYKAGAVLPSAHPLT